MASLREAGALSDYRVQIDIFSGPLDLLLYLIRRDELDVEDIPIARVTAQYLEFIRVLEQLDPNNVSDFLVMATTLVEMKTRALLPTPPVEALDDEDDDPRAQLVKQLLEYKRFKDAARALGSAAAERQKRYVRVPAELPREMQGLELEEAEVWDLVATFSKILTATGQRSSHDIRVDDTPIATYMDRIIARLDEVETFSLRQMLTERRDRAEIIGVFLAILELIRNKVVRAEQDGVGHEIYLFRQVEVSYDEDEPEQEGEGGHPKPRIVSADAEAVEPSPAPSEPSDTPNEEDLHEHAE